jgi:hypothetical protein
MKIDYSVVKNPDHHTTHGSLARTEGGSFFWYEDDPKPPITDYAVLAKNSQGKLIGIQKFDLVSEEGGAVLESYATYVWPLYREEGIACQMWAKALESSKAVKVRVKAVSDRGKTLVQSLQIKFPTVEFELLDGGERTLRSLKGKARRKAG